MTIKDEQHELVDRLDEDATTELVTLEDHDARS
jgi:hypothetical protein